MPLAAAVARAAAGAEPAVLLAAGVRGHAHPLRMLLADDRADVSVLPDTLADDRSVLGVRLSRRAAAALPAIAGLAGRGADGLAGLGALADRLRAALPVDGSLRVLDPGRLVATTAEPDHPRCERALAAVEAAGGEERVRVEQSVKRPDNPVAAHLIAPWSKRLAAALVHRRLAPDAVTIASLVVALLSALAAATGTRTGFVLAAVAMLVSFALDCTDGQMARYAVRYSALGAWLDGFGDRLKEQLVLAGMAVGGVHAALLGGATQQDAAQLWLLAAAAGAVTLVRHLVGFGYTAALRLPSTPPVPAGRLDRSQRLRFDLRKTAMLPFGERTLLTAVLLAATSPRLVFVVLVAAGALATAAMLAGRVRRTAAAAAVRSRRVFDAAGRRLVAVLADAGGTARTGAGWLRGRGRTVLAVPASVLVAGLPTVGLLTAAVWTGGPGHVLLPAVLSLVAAVWWALTGAVGAARPGGWLAWLLPAATGFVEAATVLVAARTLVAGFGSGVPAAHVLAGSAFVLLALVAMHRYGREYAGSLAGQAGRGSALAARVALGHESRLLLVTLLALLAVWTGAGWLARVALWLPAGLVLASLGLASAGEVRAALRLQRLRR